MKNKGYKTRIADRLLERKLQGKGAVLIEGAKWCGKTTTAEQITHPFPDFIIAYPCFITPPIIHRA